MEEQLLKPYHQNILDLGDGNAESLQSVIANLYVMSSEEGFDIDMLYTKAVKSDDVSAYCLCCYLQFDDGADRLANALADKAEKPDAQEILDAVQEYKRFYKHNRKKEEAEITTDELNILTLRRWHYDHPEEYKEFTDTFQKAYDGDMTFIQTNFFTHCLRKIFIENRIILGLYANYTSFRVNRSLKYHFIAIFALYLKIYC